MRLVILGQVALQFDCFFAVSPKCRLVWSVFELAVSMLTNGCKKRKHWAYKSCHVHLAHCRCEQMHPVMANMQALTHFMTAVSECEPMVTFMWKLNRFFAFFLFLSSIMLEITQTILMRKHLLHRRSLPQSKLKSPEMRMMTAPLLTRTKKRKESQLSSTKNQNRKNLLIGMIQHRLIGVTKTTTQPNSKHRVSRPPVRPLQLVNKYSSAPHVSINN